MTTDSDHLPLMIRLYACASVFSCDDADGHVNVSSGPSFSADHLLVASMSLAHTLSLAFPHPVPADSHSQGCHGSNKDYCE